MAAGGGATKDAFCSLLYSTLLNITLLALVTKKQLCISENIWKKTQENRGANWEERVQNNGPHEKTYISSLFLYTVIIILNISWKNFIHNNNAYKTKQNKPPKTTRNHKGLR